MAAITLAGGCFWCTEAVYKEIDGVTNVTSGYTGGHVENPTYEAVCDESTGHAESITVEFDPAVVSLRELLSVFFAIHDPTTIDRQGPDAGSQYRSAVFYRNAEQRATVEEVIDDLESNGVYDDPIVTEIESLETFYDAEDYHQDYFEKNPDQPYCTMQIPPKLSKLESKFPSLLAK